jgi:hypothetical protein
MLGKYIDSKDIFSICYIFGLLFFHRSLNQPADFDDFYGQIIYSLWGASTLGGSGFSHQGMRCHQFLTAETPVNQNYRLSSGFSQGTLQLTS